jgi:hypothetical protein
VALRGGKEDSLEFIVESLLTAAKNSSFSFSLVLRKRDCKINGFAYFELTENITNFIQETKRNFQDVYGNATNFSTSLRRRQVGKKLQNFNQTIFLVCAA